MKIASIVPMKNVGYTYSGSYAMLLAHLKNYYPKCNNKNCYKIMDNSLIELGGAVTVKDVYEAGKFCNANEIVLPDVFCDGAATFLEVVKSIEWLRKNKHLGEMRLMAVCQGKNEEEFRDCFSQLSKIPEIHCIGIPKVAETLTEKGRPGFEDIWQGCSKAIHLLGCWTSLRELGEYKHPEVIRSIDTCIPALLSKTSTYAYATRPATTINLLHDEIDMVSYKYMIHRLEEDGWI